MTCLFHRAYFDGCPYNDPCPGECMGYREKAPAKRTALPTDAKARKNAPMDRGLLRYFPRALAYVAEVSRIGNEQHNPGQPMHWAREKSTDHGDCIVRHQCEAGTMDADNVRHSGKVAWRALAQLELELEESEES